MYRPAGATIHNALAAFEDIVRSTGQKFLEKTLVRHFLIEKFQNRTSLQSLSSNLLAFYFRQIKIKYCNCF
jgi:hypothetical protein